MSTNPLPAARAARDTDGVRPGAAGSPGRQPKPPEPPASEPPGGGAAERVGDPPIVSPAPEGTGEATPHLTRTERLLRHLERIEHSVRKVRAGLASPARHGARPRQAPAGAPVAPDPARLEARPDAGR